jgi:hypothetical protein
MSLEFEVDSAAWLTEIRWWQATNNAPSSATRQGALYSVTSAAAGTNVTGFISFPTTVSGWNTLTFAPPVELTVDQRYRVVVFHPAGRYSADPNYYSSGAGSTDLVNGPLRVPSAANTTGNDQNAFLQSGTPGYPVDSFNATRYWIDVAVTDTDPGGGAVSGTGVANLGGLAATAAGVRTVRGVCASALGGLAGIAVGRRTSVGVAAASVGALTASASGVRLVRGSGLATVGPLTATVNLEPPAIQGAMHYTSRVAAGMAHTERTAATMGAG